MAEKETFQPLLSVIAPMCNEEGNVVVFLQSLTRQLLNLGVTYEIILVDDGSFDGTWSLIKKMTEADCNIKGISLARNFGHQNAVFAGLAHCFGKAIITMDSDLQHPPEKIPEMYRAWKEGYKIVEAIRIDSEDTSLFKRMSSKCFNRFFSLFSGLPMESGTSDFRLLDSSVLKLLLSMQDADIFMRGMIHWVGFDKKTIIFEANKRYSGSTKFNYRALLKYSIRAMFSFSSKPLKFGIWVGIITSLLAFCELIFILIQYFQGRTVPGWASILTVISFMFGILFILMGILGAYIGKIFVMLKNRPRYIIKDYSGAIGEVNQK